MGLNRERQGEIFIFIEAALWGLFPVITILSYRNLPTLISLAASTLFAAIFFGVIIFIKKRWHELFNKEAFVDIIFATFFIGILYYLFTFFGLSATSAGNASLIAKTEIFFSYLFFHKWRKDFIPQDHILGAALMVFGAFIVLYPNLHQFQIGDLFILAAAAIAPFGNFFAQRARKKVSSETIMFIRSLLSATFIFLLTFILRINISFESVKSSIFILAISGIFLLGLSKLLWLEGIHRISVTKANALGSITPLLTLIFAWILLKTAPTIWQLFSFIPMFFGVILLSRGNRVE